MHNCAIHVSMGWATYDTEIPFANVRKRSHLNVNGSHLVLCSPDRRADLQEWLFSRGLKEPFQRQDGEDKDEIEALIYIARLAKSSLMHKRLEE